MTDDAHHRDTEGTENGGGDIKAHEIEPLALELTRNMFRLAVTVIRATINDALDELLTRSEQAIAEGEALVKAKTEKEKTA